MHNELARDARAAHGAQILVQAVLCHASLAVEEVETRHQHGVARRRDTYLPPHVPTPVSEWETWWAHTGGGNALAFKQPTDHMILRGDLLGSHGRWKRPCLQTAHMRPVEYPIQTKGYAPVRRQSSHGGSGPTWHSTRMSMSLVVSSTCRLATTSCCCSAATAREASGRCQPTEAQNVANRNGRDFGWEIAHAAVSRRPPISLSRVVARTHMYTYAPKCWDSSIVQGPVSVRTRPGHDTSTV
jgi:hypothetical protein